MDDYIKDACDKAMKGYENQDKPLMVFDWERAAQIIRDRGPKTAEAYLETDYFWTGSDIYQDGKPILDATPYLHSTWARPMLILNGEEPGIACFKMENEVSWSGKDCWPGQSLKILGYDPHKRLVRKLDVED